MEIKFDELIEKFYKEKIKNHDKFKTITLDQLKLILRCPFKFIRSLMVSDNVDDIRLKFFGSWKINKRHLRYLDKVNERNLVEKKISEEEYLKVKQKIYNKLKDTNEEEDYD